MLGGPIGAAMGAALGHNFDHGLGQVGTGGFAGDVERIQTAFFTATFATMGHVAKADGQVSPQEIIVAEDVMRQMRLSPQQKQVAQGLFNEGKKGNIPISDLLHQFRIECHRRRNLLQMFMEIQVAVALSDGTLDASESRILENAADILGFSRAEYQAILQRMQAHRHAQASGQAGMALQGAYKLLGIDKGTSDLGGEEGLPQADEPASSGQAGVQGLARGDDGNGEQEGPGNPDGLRDHQGIP